METNLAPLQVRTILLRADQRQATSNPPLLPISEEQILHDELPLLLTEDDYNLATMVNLKVYTTYFNSYLSVDYNPISLSKSITC